MKRLLAAARGVSLALGVMMRWLNLGAVLLVAASQVIGAASGLGDDPQKFDQLIEAAHLRRDLAFLQASVAADAWFSHFREGPDEDLSHWLATVRMFSGASRDVEAVRTERHSDVVITTGRIRVVGGGSRPEAYRVWYVRVYIAGADGWKLASHRTVAQENVEVPATMTADPGQFVNGGYRAGDGVSLPRIVHDARPNYTSEAMRAKIEGSIVLECLVKPDGTVGDVHVIRSLDAKFGLDQEAIKSAKQWRFEPGRKDGAAVPVWITIEMAFGLGK